jgi:hypothetical protein
MVSFAARSPPGVLVADVSGAHRRRRSGMLQGVLLSLVVAVAMVAIGFGLTGAMGARLRLEERVAIGVVTGVLAVNAAMLLAFLAIGMGPVTLALGLVVPAAFAVPVAVRSRAAFGREVGSARRRLGHRWSRAGSLRPLLVLGLAAGAVSTRILALSYQRTDDGVSVGSLATWGDWSAHLAYAGSFAYGDNRGLDLPIATGTPFRYHFLVDFFGALFTVSGATLEQSMALSAWMLAVVLPVLLWSVVLRLTRSTATALITVLLFVLSGGIGAYYFAVDVHQRGWSILGTLPQTYARIPDQQLWVDNTISASLYAQRSTLLGLAVGSSALILLLAARPRWERRGFLAAGLLVAGLGIGHAHTLATAVALASLAWLVDWRRTWAWFVVPAIVIGLPLTLAIAPEDNSMRIMLGWMAPGAGQSWPWFWFRNAGLLLPIAGVLALVGGGMPRVRRLTAPLWLWFLVPNVIAFHPSEWNNTKFFLFWQFGSCLLVATWLVRSWTRARSASMKTVRLAVPALVIVCVGFMVSAGALDTVRAMQRSTAIVWASEAQLDAASWLRDNTPTDAVLVYGMQNYSAQMSLGGRRVVTAYTGWTYDLGLADWDDRWSATREILAGGPGAEAAIERYGVDYVIIGRFERDEHQASDSYWAKRGEAVFAHGGERIYRVRR